MNFTRRLITLMLTMVLFISCFAVSASAAEIWSDLQFQDGAPIDATGNTSMIMVGGAAAKRHYHQLQNSGYSSPKRLCRGHQPVR